MAWTFCTRLDPKGSAREPFQRVPAPQYFDAGNIGPGNPHVPLRAYLAGLTVLFVVAAGAAVVYGRIQAGGDARSAAQADARFAARLAAREIGEGIKVLQNTVAGGAANPGAVKAFARPEDCGLTFGGTDAYTTGHLDLVRGDGSVACSSMDQALERGYGGAGWLARATREPLLLAPAADPRTGEQVVLATAPVAKLGFVLASFNLDDVGVSLRDSYGGARGLELLLTDKNGATVLTRSIQPERWIGGSPVPPRSPTTATWTGPPACKGARPCPASAGACTPAAIAPRRSPPPGSSTAASS
jgi:hypothetical protein